MAFSSQNLAKLVCVVCKLIIIDNFPWYIYLFRIRWADTWRVWGSEPAGGEED